MSVTTSPELFINIKKVPGLDSRDYKSFWSEEKRKCINGITINGIYIPGWLYWHTNHWWIDIDGEQDPITGVIPRMESKALLRDNEWIVGNAIHDAEFNHKGLLLWGTRQFSKSETQASYTAYKSICFKNSQNIVAGLSEPDLKMLTGKIDRGFSRLDTYFSPSTTAKKDWDKQVILGYRDKRGNIIKHSEILIRNLWKGNNTEGLAGPTATSLVIDEAGKDDFLESLIAAKPALESQYGWRCSPLVCGTSGSFEKAQDLITLSTKLEAFNFISCKVPDKIRGVTYGFMPGYMASKSKRKKVRLSDYLRVKRGSELDVTPIYIVANQEQAIADILSDRKKLEDAGEVTLLKKEIMYYPLNEEELFLSANEHDTFADIREMAKEHLAYIESVEVEEEYGFMTRDTKSGEVRFVKSNKKPITDFPIKETDYKKIDFDAPIIVWEKPIPGQEYGVLHVSGGDFYKQDDVVDSPSLGSFFVFRRTYDPLNGKAQQSFVAEYTARPAKMKRFFEQIEMLMEWYQATMLPENEDPEVIRFFDTKHKAHWIEDGIDLAKEINPNTKIKRIKGLSASTANINYGNGKLIEYCKEDVVVGQDVNGDNIIKPGIVRIKSKGLLKEIIYHKNGLNVDRIVGSRHALILAGVKDKFYPVSKLKEVVKEKKEPSQSKTPKIPFSIHYNKSPFGNKRKNPFNV